MRPWYDGDWRLKTTPEVQAVFQFMLAVAMEGSGIAKRINAARIDGRASYSYKSVSGDVYSVVRPEPSPEFGQGLRGVLVESLLVEES